MAPQKKSLADSAKDSLKNNPSALGDPVSLKAETADSSPTENDRGAANDKSSLGAGAGAGGNKKSDGHTENDGSLGAAAMKNPSLLGDPVSLKAEKSQSEPTEADRGAGRKGKGDSKL